MTVATSDEFCAYVAERHPGDTDFHHAVRDVVADVWDDYAHTDGHREARILERLIEPDRLVSFRVTWEDDDGAVHVNRGTRVQHNDALGPYKGGIRFHPTVTADTLKFLAFEQTFKNALTDLPMGGGKGGADFDPKWRSDREIMRFCQAFMGELHRYIGPDTDIPAGDINVGEREIGYLFGAYRKIKNAYEGALTGKGLSFGGSPLRTEATGFGLMHFVRAIAKAQGRSIEGERVAISGAGNVATHAAECAIVHGAKVVTLSDSGGTLCCDSGLTHDTVANIRAHKSDGGRLSDFAERNGFDFEGDAKPWAIACAIALPCATQNELDEADARALADGHCWLIGEGANMPLTAEARSVVDESDIVLAPAKAANAGGVAISGLEIMQNQMRKALTRNEVSDELARIMTRIHDTCTEFGGGDGKRVDYPRGANRAAYHRVARAMLAQGVR
ncbi:MAG: NADP-specific glutamate dehydrogenase [Pseudomonadota bacterium]